MPAAHKMKSLGKMASNNIAKHADDIQKYDTSPLVKSHQII